MTIESAHIRSTQELSLETLVSGQTAPVSSNNIGQYVTALANEPFNQAAERAQSTFSSETTTSRHIPSRQNPTENAAAQYQSDPRALLRRHGFQI